VIETFIIDWPVLLTIGLVFGGRASGRALARRAFILGSVAALVFIATALISYAIAPDWMWMYFLDPADVAWSVPLIALGYLFFYVVGFAAGVTLGRVSKLSLWSAIGAALGLEAGVVALTWDRYHLIGSAAEWASGRAHELFSASPTGPARTISLLGPVFLITLGAGLYLTWRDERATAARR
jgi:hypothetical protein